MTLNLIKEFYNTISALTRPDSAFRYNNFETIYYKFKTNGMITAVVRLVLLQ